ncbi:MAG: hypothetical protein QXD11_02105 [Candidatus Micrarchaeaceae archaeon]
MKCSYCSSEIEKGRGIMYVYNNGTIKYYCSSSCYKNDMMKRKINKKIIKGKKA